jgi:nucleotide-binding universal stress UspA family protein
MIRSILAPTDFSEASQAGLDYAVDLAKRLRARLTVICVVEPIPVVIPARSLPADTARLIAEQQYHSKARFTRLTEDLKKRRVKFKAILTIGTPYEQIIEAARRLEVDLIVMATHGRSALSQFLLGSVAEKVVRFAPCPVLVVRDPGAGRRRRKATPRAGRTV